MDKNKMLIDATHPEETRVVVLRNGRVEEFDYEFAARKLLRGNIYLAKVTRVEPSLQAAFVEYGGNRHGFLAFDEIHPDYYQIPIADRELLKREEAEAKSRADAEVDDRSNDRGSRRRRRGRGRSDSSDSAASSERLDADADYGGPERGDRAASLEHVDRDEPLRHDLDDQPRSDFAPRDDLGDPAPQHDYPDDIETGDALAAADGDAADDQIEQVATGDDALEELPERPRRRARQYKIQEVIKRRQIILIQVVKEERGNKGAALTTYISLAGRYTVLMPNTGRGGGISRKITQPQDRRRLKAIAEDLDVSEGMGLIIRTAGASRSLQDIKRDYEYLLRLWESVRELTLSSTAPCLVYEEGNLIKRSIRDLYSKDIDDVIVAGDGAYREASDFMGMLMPGNANYVVRYQEPEPLFTRYGIERQLNAMFSPYVTLRSGGYCVINQTEALVAVDVNSGKSTREFSIEETALNTNLEAAEEIARQLKLRDLAGLIVIDFIDMEERRNNRKVENRLKDALRFDRARIQVGRISHFGLMEMSRQRLRTGVLEGSTSQCPHCQGTGIIRSVESVALAVLRSLEDHLLKQVSSLSASMAAGVALYILNHKRPFITEMERRYGVQITVEASDRMQGANFAIERTAVPVVAVKPTGRGAVSMEWGFDGEEPVEAPRRDERTPDRDRDRDRPRDRVHHHDHSHDDNDRDDRPARGHDVGNGFDDEPQGDGRGGEERNGRRRRRGRRDRVEGGEGRGHDRDRNAPSRDHGRGPRPGTEASSRWRDDDVDPRDSVAAAPLRDRDDRPPPEDDVIEPVREQRGPDAPRGDRDDGEESRRRRRRGRRGGRSRGRDGEREEGRDGRETRENRPVSTEAGDWGVTDTVRPDADQPPAYREPSPMPRDAQPERGEQSPRRSTIIETVDSPPPSADHPPRVPEPQRLVETAQRPPVQDTAPPPSDEPSGASRKGWWQRRFGGG